MKKSILFVALFAFTQFGYAALPPQYQNPKDLNVMVSFIHAHPKVLASLRSIDFTGKTVHYGNDCKAVFGRKYRFRPPGWTGPAAPLEFKKSN